MCTVKDNRPIACSQKLKCLKIKGIFMTKGQVATIQYFPKCNKGFCSLFLGGFGGGCACKGNIRGT